MGDHELVIAQKYCGNGLRRGTNGGGSSRHIRNSYAPNPSLAVKILQVGIASEPRDSKFVLNVIQLMSLMLIPKNGVSTKLVDHLPQFLIYLCYHKYSIICNIDTISGTNFWLGNCLDIWDILFWC